MSFDEQVVEGYLVSASTQKNAQASSEVPLNFQMWVTNVTSTAKAGSKDFPGKMDNSDSEFATDGSFTAEQAQQNLEATSSSKVGLLSRLRSSIASIQNDVNNAIGDFKDFLYGRNLVVPAGYAGSEQIAGVPAGASFPALSTSADNSIIIKVAAMQASVATKQTFWDNIDEYPVRAVSAAGKSLLQDRVSGISTAATVSRAELLELQISSNLDGTSFGSEYLSATQKSEAAREMASAMFAVASYAAASGGVVDAVDNITAGSVTDAAVNYDYELSAGQVTPTDVGAALLVGPLVGLP